MVVGGPTTTNWLRMDDALWAYERALTRPDNYIDEHRFLVARSTQLRALIRGSNPALERVTNG